MNYDKISDWGTVKGFFVLFEEKKSKEDTKYG
jgi:hypothetical protein